MYSATATAYTATPWTQFYDVSPAVSAVTSASVEEDDQDLPFPSVPVPSYQQTNYSDVDHSLANKVIDAEGRLLPKSTMNHAGNLKRRNDTYNDYQSQDMSDSSSAIDTTWTKLHQVETLDIYDLIHVVASDLTHVCRTNERSLDIQFNQTSSTSGGNRQASSQLRIPPDHERIFCSSYRQPFGLDFYLTRLIRYIQCSRAVYVTALIYLDRLQLGTDKFILVTEKNIHRLLLTAIVLACKYLEDEQCASTFYARCGGVTMKEMNRLEIAMLKLLNWNLSVDVDTYQVYATSIVSQALNQASTPIVSSDEEQ